MRYITTLVVVASITGVAHAQEFNGAQVVGVPRLVRVFVETKAGEHLTGRLLRLDQHTLTLLVDAKPVDLPFEGVERLQTAGDSVRNGARIGALAFGLWCAYICRQTVPGIWPYAVVTNALVGAALGAGIDAAIPGRTTVYVAPHPPGPAAAAPRPLAQLRVRF